MQTASLTFLRTFCSLALLFAVSACETTGPGAGGFSQDATRGDLVVRSTGFRFPRSVGAFTRGQTGQYDQAGQDLSVKYALEGVAVADVYDYPTGGRTLRTEFRRLQKEILAYHSDAELLEEGDQLIAPAGRRRSGLHAVYTISRGFKYDFPPPYRSQLLLFQRGNRFVEYRFTYAANKRGRAESEIRRFLGALAWPPG